MDYQQFVCVIREKVNCLLEPQINTSIHYALKNNGKERIGLTISHQATNIFPTIYLEEYFFQYQNGRTLSDIVNSIIELYHEVKFEYPWEVGKIQDFEHVSPMLAYKLIHFQENRSLLEEIPFVPYMDLAIVFYLLLGTSEKGSATILITKDLQNIWNVSLNELFQTASRNTPKLLGAELKPMHDVIQELLNKPCSADESTENYMYVLSNELRHFGAACILYDHVLEDIGNQLNEDFYVLPSSIHEVIILPASYSMKKNDLDEMIVEINETQVSEEEVLSDHAYYYSRTKRRLLMAS